MLWSPIFLITKYKTRKHVKTGPVWDVYDEIAQTKLITGLVVGIVVYVTACVLTFPFILITSWLIPIWMWMSLRWMEDLVSACRGSVALVRLLCIGRENLSALRDVRASLLQDINALAKAYDLNAILEQEKKCSAMPNRDFGYFNITRRKKKDWNEVSFLLLIQHAML
jgi:glycerol-3-phosphate O-acyltransferase/dihydroxyacetone phosphate acyltransferase